MKTTPKPAACVRCGQSPELHQGGNQHAFQPTEPEDEREAVNVNDPTGGLFATHDYDPKTRTFTPKPAASVERDRHKDHPSCFEGCETTYPETCICDHPHGECVTCGCRLLAYSPTPPSPTSSEAVRCHCLEYYGSHHPECPTGLGRPTSSASEGATAKWLREFASREPWHVSREKLNAIADELDTKDGEILALEHTVEDLAQENRRLTAELVEIKRERGNSK